MLTVFDMDGIFIEERSSWKVIHKKFGIDNSDLVDLYLEGKISDEEFLNEDIKRWRENGIKKQDIVKVLEEIPLTPGTEECIKYCSRKGKTAIISGGIDLLAKRIAKFGIDYVFANGIEFRDDIPWKGILRVPIKRKDIVLKNLMEKIGVEKKEVIVIGDTKYDICMFKMAGLRIGFNARDELANQVDFIVEKRDLKELIKIFENY